MKTFSFLSLGVKEKENIFGCLNESLKEKGIKMFISQLLNRFSRVNRKISINFHENLIRKEKIRKEEKIQKA